MSVDSRYIRVATKFWQDEKVKSLGDDSKLLYLYVLTSPHSNMAGYYVLPKPYVAYDLNWLPERLDKAFSKLLHQGLIKYCKRSDVVLIPNFLKYNPMQNQNQAKGAARRVAELPSNTLRDDFRAVLEQYAKQFTEWFAEGFANTDTDTDTESDTESATDAREPEKESSSKPDVVDDDNTNKFLNQEITKSFSQTYGYPPNQTQLQMLLSFLNDGIPEELIFEALKRSAEAGANSPTYTRAILQSWVSKAAYTLEDIHALDNLRKPSRRDGPEGETAAERLLREEIERQQAQAEIIDIAWAEGG